ncbi:MAG: hypothetical protein RLZZ156_1240 [Deinococcota bacterium]|jgi:putative ABC transport system permease protein
MTFWLLWRNLRTRVGANSLTVLAIAIAVLMGLVVPLLLSSFRESVIRAANSFDLLITAKGSQSQAVLNTIFLQEAPIGNIPYEVFEKLTQDPRTKKAIPLAFGDNYNGFPIVGTNKDYFELRPNQSQGLLYTFAQGTVFEDEFDAVLGAQAAKVSGLKIGDTFKSQHGITPTFEPDEHAESFKVVGILEPSGAAGDKGIFVPIEAVWHLHEQEEKKEHEGKEETAHEDEHDHGEEQEITAILWTPTRLGYAYQLAGELNQDNTAQGVFPGQVIGQLFSFMGQGQEAYNLIIWLALLLATLTIAINTLSASQVMQRNLAVLRAIGASKNQVVGLVLLESLVITLVGLLVGLGLSYVITSLVQQWLEQQTALTLPNLAPNPSDLLRVATVIPVALVFALLPALLAIRNSPLKQMKR